MNQINVGCSIFWLDSGADTGDLIKQEEWDKVDEKDSELIAKFLNCDKKPEYTEYLNDPPVLYLSLFIRDTDRVDQLPVPNPKP